MGLPGDILRLTRLHTGTVTAAVPALAAIVASGEPLTVILVFFSALSNHAWGFSQNEIMDLKVDTEAGHLSHKPLVSGSMTRNMSIAISASLWFLSAALIIAASLAGGGPLPIVMALFVLSSILGTAYNLLGKKVPFMDLAVGAWFLLLIVSAGMAASPGSEMLPIVVGISVVAGVHLVFNNMIEGGLKDVATDEKAGVRSAAVILGVRFIEGRIRIPWKFLAVGWSLKAVFVAGASVLAYIVYTESGSFAAMVLTIAGGSIVFGHSLRFLRPSIEVERRELLRTFSVHEISSFSLSILAISSILGPWVSIVAIVIPILWFASLNRIMYSKTMVPGV